MKLSPIDYAILVLYFSFVIGIGWRLRKSVTSAGDFLTAGHKVPLWITSLAFLAANLGAQEVVGMCASGAKYGIMTAHFYWIGAVPAMLFVGVFMMPFYYGSRARSVPEYLKLRFDEKTRGLNAIAFAIMTLFSSGISMYALGRMFQLVLGWSFDASVVLSAVIVLVYTYLGGLRSAIYNEVLQFFLIVIGFSPLSILAVQRAGGWSGLQQKLPDVMTHTWKYIGNSSQNPMGVEAFGLFAGLGFVLSFGYWCTDFLVVQRAMAAENMSDARRTPLLAAFPKMIMPFIVIVPGIAALALTKSGGGYSLPVKGAGYDYDQALTTLMAQFYPSGMLGVGLTALMASFMSGMAGNVTAFNTVFTYDIYQGYIRPKASDAHYLTVGRITTVAGIALSIATAYLATHFNNIMDFLQLIFGFVNAPLFATFLLGMFWKRTTGHGAFFGLLSGTGAAAATYGLTLAEDKGGWIATTARAESELKGLVYGLTDVPRETGINWYQRPVPLAIVVCAALVVLNLLFL
jgi:SSS family solute:Na+ symporter